jgi:cytochrome c-type biogenesis protein
MLSGPFALAFSAGMLATINPCGFAMLPAYLSYFLGLDAPESERPDRSVLRALAVGGVLTLGFVAVFGVIGAIYVHLASWVIDYTHYLTIFIGLGLVILGITMLRGFEPTLKLPKLSKGTGSRELWSMFLFGVSYAVASLSCTIAPFLGMVSTTFRQESFASGVATFVVYGLGMGTVVVFLTVYTALANTSLVRRLRQLLPYINRISGVLLILTGLYLGYYGIYEIRVQNGDLRRDSLVDRFTRLQADANQWITNVGAVRLGLLLGLATAAAVAYAMLRRRESGGDTSTRS